MSVIDVVTQVLLWAAVAMIAGAAALTLWRLTVGPSTLDRIISSELTNSQTNLDLALIITTHHHTNVVLD